MINFLANLVSQKHDKLKQGHVQLTKNQAARTKADRKRIIQLLKYRSSNISESVLGNATYQKPKTQMTERGI